MEEIRLSPVAKAPSHKEKLPKVFTQRLRTDLELSVRVTIATQLVCQTG